ncbi:MAG: hypothetical protein D3904_12780 [Candidatus Electrothrix sp. EH2]|nr:hypothetical protein [Candidatus Electrothrix sp. EH2]
MLDISLLDEEGKPLVEISGYGLRRTGTETHAYQELFSKAENFRLAVGTKGDLSSLRLQADERRTPDDDEIEIQVSATALNFKEVLYALDMLQMPEEFRFGLECAGRVSRVGRQVTAFAPGDRVVAFTSGGLGRFVNVAGDCAALQPASLQAVEAATLPVAYVTAYHALITVGHLQEGERVLIHAAAGGVGMAAVRIAQWANAEIFATAGSMQKRDYLHSLGIQYVMDSRSGDFAAQIMDTTKNQGVDVVLNSLAGDLMLKNFEVLAPFGRFLELGVRDIYHNTPLGLKAFSQGQSYAAVQLGPATPGFQNDFKTVLQLIETGELPLLPSRVYPLGKITEAFEYIWPAPATSANW